jgi:hypothetical protein
LNKYRTFSEFFYGYWEFSENYWTTIFKTWYRVIWNQTCCFVFWPHVCQYESYNMTRVEKKLVSNYNKSFFLNYHIIWLIWIMVLVNRKYSFLRYDQNNQRNFVWESKFYNFLEQSKDKASKKLIITEKIWVDITDFSEKVIRFT